MGMCRLIRRTIYRSDVLFILINSRSLRAANLRNKENEMKKVFGRIFSVALTSILFLSYLYDFSYGVTFASVIIWALVALLVFAMIPLSVYIISKHDRGELDGDYLKKRFNAKNKTTPITKLLSWIMTLSQTALLVIVGSPVLAAFYFTANMTALVLLLNLEKRAVH